MELFTESEKQFLLTALDTHVRAQGINVAKNAVVVAMKLNGEIPIDAGEETAEADIVE